jgi:hypothetical protein
VLAMEILRWREAENIVDSAATTRRMSSST